MAGSMSKLGLDAVIQRDVAEDTRASAFARTETGLQLAWVVGGAIGLIPLPGVAGFALAAGGMALALLFELSALRRVRARRGLRPRRTLPGRPRARRRRSTRLSIASPWWHRRPAVLTSTRGPVDTTPLGPPRLVRRSRVRSGWTTLRLADPAVRPRSGALAASAQHRGARAQYDGRVHGRVEPAQDAQQVH